MERLRPWLRAHTAGYLLVAVALAVLAWRAAGGGAGGAQPRPERTTTGTGSVAMVRDEPSRYLVHVAGAVRRPGVYEIGGDGRVIQAIRLAGGPTRRADLAGVNLAAPVQDGQQIVVPARVTAATGAPAQSAASGRAAGPVSLSSATVEQLDGLDGIGPTLAARIVEWRQSHGGFRTVDDLQEVPGIGDARMEALRDKVTP